MNDPEWLESLGATIEPVTPLWSDYHSARVFSGKRKMLCFTAQMSVKCPEGYLVIDTTVKSAQGDNIYLAPTKEMRNGSKYNGWSWERYTTEFLKLMNIHWREHRDAFTGIMYATVPVVLKCYCQAEKYPCCHRYLLAERVFPKLCELKDIDYEYRGEIS